MEKFEGKKIAILGFGVEGKSVIEFLHGSNALITIFDEKKREDFESNELEKLEQGGVEFVFGAFSSLLSFDIIFRSPGIKPSLPQLVEAKEKGIEVTSAIKVFFDLCPCPIVGVTGTKGKGTTSTLIYEMLKEEARLADDDESRRKFDAYLGGNIGTPPLEFLPKLTPDSKVVLELSSFQLIDLEKSPADAKAMAGKPHVAVMLMTTSEHLDYHTDVYEYIDAKRNIFRYQTQNDFAIVNRDYPASNESDIHSNGKVYRVSREQDVDQGCYVKEDGIYLKMDGEAVEILKTEEIALIGKHNLENVCAAVVASLCAGATMKSIIPVLKSFKGLEHRIEFVRLARGVKYFDDSFSTTPETAIAAIESFTEPKILILGGSSKNSDFTELGEIISKSDSVKAIIGIGTEWEKIKERIMNHESRIMVIENCKNMEEIVKKCAEIGEIGDVVLLSPACASFDMFRSYKDRGEQFKKEVNLL